jgi:Zn-dependent M28 family amino/carboxypeptidase
VAWWWIAAAAILASLGLAFLCQPFVAPVRFEGPGADPARLERHVVALTTRFHPRSYRHEANLAAAARYIRDELARGIAEVSEQPVQSGPFRAVNVIGRYGPRDGALLVIGAHYDVAGDSNPGADDNASGVAGLLELARLLGEHPPRRPVELVAFAFEEPPIFRSDAMGSLAHARALRGSNREVALMISIEMIGYYDSRPGSQRYPLPGLGLLYPSTADFIALVGRPAEWRAVRHVKSVMKGASPLAVHSINIGAWVPGVDFSDHSSYWREGFAALMVTDTAFYRNPHYHSATDTADRLDYARMAHVVRGLFALASR